MGYVADVCQSTPHDDSGSYDGGDSEVKMTRLATGTLRQPQCGSKTRSGTSSKEAAHRLAAASWVTPGAGAVPCDLASKPATSKPDQESWDFDENEQDFGEEKNLPKPHANP
jgi:hypothetical protein